MDHLHTRLIVGGNESVGFDKSSQHTLMANLLWQIRSGQLLNSGIKQGMRLGCHGITLGSTERSFVGHKRGFLSGIDCLDVAEDQLKLKSGRLG